MATPEHFAAPRPRPIRIGTRRGLTLTVVWYSTVAMLTSLARGFYSFATFRFLLGAGRIS